jgi:hypothetical protein
MIIILLIIYSYQLDLTTISNECEVAVYFIEEIKPYPEMVNVKTTKKWGISLTAPILKYAVPDPEYDAHLCIINRSTNEEWDYGRFRGKYPRLNVIMVILYQEV